MMRCYIGLGSNLAEPILQIRNAFNELAKMPDCILIAKSSLYRSPALIAPDQPDTFDAPDFINAVVVIDTSLTAHELMDKLSAIEKVHGRTPKTSHWASRTLDLDLLLYGHMVINSPKLIIPHPELAKRNFVLFPLAEIAPNLILPDGRSIEELLLACPKDNLTLVAKD